jgi:hypothetical protein
MVLEPGERLSRPFALEQHVADHPPLAGDRLVGEETDPGHRFAVVATVAAAEQLVAAADGEQRRAALDRRRDRCPLPDEIGRDQRLLAILAAADVEEVVRARPDLVPDADPRHLELVAAQRRPPGEDRDVAAVGVDVQIVGIQMADANLHVRSQYGLDHPRSATIRCSASIAV